MNPKPGSKAVAAKEFGIDLTLLIKNLRLTPQQRVENLQKSMRRLDNFAREAEKKIEFLRKIILLFTVIANCLKGRVV